jgi:Schlafen, AlbA_2
MRILRAPLMSIVAADITQLCSDEVSEGTEVEFKQELPSRDRKTPDGWRSGQPFGEYARNEIAQEIVAFANTLGGVVVLGIEESDDHPKRAKAIIPIPRVHELARRLRQAVYDIIDPPLPMLDAIGIDISGDGSGVVVVRVPASRRKPHRLQSNREVYIRRADESVKIGMRQIQELTIQSVAEGTRVNETILERRAKFRTALHDWLKTRQPPTAAPGGGLHIVAMPTTLLDLGRVVGRPELTAFRARVTARFGEREHLCAFPMSRHSQWKPGLRLIRDETQSEHRMDSHQLETSGICEFYFFFTMDDRHPGVFIEWLIGALGNIFSWIEIIRTGAGDVAGEYAVAVQMPIFGRDALLVEYGVTQFSSAYGNTIPIGFHQFPIISVGGAEEFPQHLQRFDEDIWNLAGHDIQRNAPTFEFSR